MCQLINVAIDKAESDLKQLETPYELSGYEFDVHFQQILWFIVWSHAVNA